MAISTPDPIALNSQSLPVTRSSTIGAVDITIRGVLQAIFKGELETYLEGKLFVKDNITIDNGTSAAIDISMANTAGAFILRVGTGGALTIRDTASGNISITIDSSGNIKFNQLTRYTETVTTADPTTTEYPTDGDAGFHRNTTSGNNFWAYNRNGTIFKVQVT